jgi:hypothetical protein
MHHFAVNLELQSQQNKKCYEMLIDLRFDFHLKQQKFHQLLIEQTIKKVNQIKSNNLLYITLFDANPQNAKSAHLLSLQAYGQVLKSKPSESSFPHHVRPLTKATASVSSKVI